MTEAELLNAFGRCLDDEDALLALVAGILPTRFGRCVVGAVDWRRAARLVLGNLREEGSYPYRAEDCLRHTDAVALEISEWSATDDSDYSWFTTAEQARRRATDTDPSACAR